MNDRNPQVDEFLRLANQWRNEMTELRTIVLDRGLTEAVKWGVPCYTHKGGNVVLIHGFKEYCALLFVKGALLRDPEGILIRQTENVQAGRQIRFSDMREIIARKPALIAYLDEAIAIERAGLKVEYVDNADPRYPEEFERMLTGNPVLKTAFDTLTPGRKRAYNLYFSAPKQAKTRISRIESCMPRMLAGKGLND